MLLASLFLISTLTSVRAETYAEKYHWAKAVQENYGATLECYEPKANINLSDTGSVQWKKEDGGEISTNDSGFLLQDLQNYKNMRLTIYKVNSTNSGVYKCILTGKGTDTTLIRGINVNGPIHTKFLDQYEHNIIVAVVATIVFLVPLFGSCVVYKFRYIDEEEGKQNMFHMTHGESDNGQAMVEKKTIAANVEAYEGGGAYDNVKGYDNTDGIDTKL